MKRKTKKTCLLLLSLNLLCGQAAPALTLMAQENTELPAPGQDNPAAPEDAANTDSGKNPTGDGTAPDNPTVSESILHNPEPDPQAPAPETPTPADPAEETDPETDEKEENGSPFTETADGLQYVLEDGTVVTGWFTLEGRTYAVPPFKARCSCRYSSAFKYVNISFSLNTFSNVSRTNPYCFAICPSCPLL